MSLTENDLELLETYLDGELPTDAAAALTQKLSLSPELAGGLELLRAERAARAQAWRSFEPGALELDRLAERLERAIGQQPLHPVWNRVLSIGRVVTAAAACIVMGIAIGRIGSARDAVLAPGTMGGQVAGPSGAAPQVPADVILTDDTGRIFVQRFPSAQAARQFVEDLHRAREQQLREAAAAPPQTPEQF
jgi:anti-sigma factor RsiW